MKKNFYSFIFTAFLLILFIYNSAAQNCTGITASYTIKESRCASTGELYIAASGGSGNYLYKVSGPINTNFSTSDTITGLPAGKYQVIIKDLPGNCLYQTDSVIIPGNYQAPSFLMNKTDVTCINGNDGAINVYNLQYGRSPFLYSIIAPSASNVGMQNNTGLFTGLLYGDYIIQLEDSCGGIQTRSMTIDNYDWWIDSIDVLRICDSASAIIKLKDSRGVVSPDSVFSLFTYAVVRATGDTVWSSSVPFTFYLGKARGLTLLAKDKCGNVKTMTWAETRIPSVNANVSVTHAACSTFNVSITGVANFIQPKYCLYDSNNILISCDTSGIYKNLPYGSYCITISDACYDTIITRCFTILRPVPSVGATIAVSNTSCTHFTATVTVQTNLNNPQFCIYGKDSTLITCNTTGVFDSLEYGTYCIKIFNDSSCYDTTIIRCFTITPPIPSVGSINVVRHCATITISAGNATGFNNPVFCLYDANNVLIICNATGVFDSLPYGTYCIEATNGPGCYDTTIRVCITVTRAIPGVGATVKTSAKTCSSFTAEIQNQQNLSSPQYCLYNSSNILLACNTTGKFTSLAYGSYCIRITNDSTCYDTVITRCFTVTQPALNYSLSTVKSCTAYGTTDLTVSISSGVSPYNINILDDAGNVLVSAISTSSTYKTYGLPNIAPPGKFTVIVTDQCGRTDTLEVAPTPSLLTKSITLTRKCPSGINPAGGADVNITATTNMGTLTPKVIKKNNAPFTINYNYHSGSLYRFNQLPPADYIIEYSTTGCTIKLFDTIRVSPYVYPDLSQSRAYHCDSNSISIGAVVTGGIQPYLYEIFQNMPVNPTLITPPQANPIFTFNNTTNYTLIRLRARDGCGNASINDVSMQPLAPVLISPSAPFHCLNDSLRLRVDTIANAVYAWYHKTSPTDSVLVSSTYWYFIPVITPQDTGQYVCHVSINNFCVNRSAYYYVQNMCGIVLPVRLTLKGQALDNVNKLQWITSNEEGVKSYALERSSNGRTAFMPIASVVYKGSGTSNEYIYADEKPEPGNNYYRLKIIGSNGNFMYSNTVLLKNRSFSVLAYPNPVQQELFIDVTNMPPGKYKIDIYNAAGAKVQTVNTAVMQSNLIKINRETSVKPGLHLVVITNTENAIQQFVKVMYQ